MRRKLLISAAALMLAASPALSQTLINPPSGAGSGVPANLTLTNPASAATLTIQGGTTVTGPASSGTLATLGANTFTGTQNLSAGVVAQLGGISLLKASPITTAYLSGCGTSPSIATNGTLVGAITIGTSPTTSCTINFSSLMTTSHGFVCLPNDETTAGIMARETAATTTSVTLSFYATGTTTLTAPTAGDVIGFFCGGY